MNEIEKLIKWHDRRANSMMEIGEPVNAKLHFDWAFALRKLVEERNALFNALNNVTTPR